MFGFNGQTQPELKSHYSKPKSMLSGKDNTVWQTEVSVYDPLDQVSKFMYLCIDWLIDELTFLVIYPLAHQFCRYGILYSMGYLIFCMQDVLLSSPKKTKKW